MALVIVLGMLVLVLILVIAFFSSVSVDLQSAKRYSSGTAAKTLADSAVSLVISQIQDATAAPNLAWASQPGMIRTYNDQGAPVTAFKLYSSNQLRVDGGFGTVLQAAEVPGDWAGSTTLFTDLNKPVAVAGVNHYPILDPAAVAKDVSGGTAVVSGASPIEGCFLDTGNAATTTSATQTNPVPMPVQWMYVLESGKLATMNPATKIIAGASPDDPIVGRIAFWTDDETSKVNINTASEGTFWDRPWTDGVATGYERRLSNNMPVQNEFQRYPGHPAMTSLSVIFPPLAGETMVQYNNRIADIIPRVSYKDASNVYAGSQSGTVAVTGTSKALIADTERLFASVDEFLFKVTANVNTSNPRTPNLKDSSNVFTENDIEKTRFFLTASSRAPEVNLFNKPRVAVWPLQANTADVSDPVNAPERNAHDKLIAFCSTIGTKPYYFQRFNTFDPSKIRLPGAPYNPAQNPIPSSQSPSMDWSNIPRNQDIFRYLQKLTSSPIPGLGGTLSGSGGKYSTPVRDQILTEMMDFVRSGVNTFNTKPAPPAVATNTPYYTYVPFGVNAAGAASGWVTGQSQVVPLVIQPPDSTLTTKGFGRFSTVTQAVLVFIRTDKVQYVPNPAATSSIPQDMPDTSTKLPGKFTVLDGIPITIPPFPTPFTPPASPFVDGSGKPVPIRIPTMKAVLLLQTFNPTPGPPPWSGNVRYVLEKLDSLSVTSGGVTSPLGFPSTMVNLVNDQEGYYDATALTGLETCTEYWNNGSAVPAPKVKGIKSVGPTVVGAADEEEYYPFVSAEIPLNGPTFKIEGGTTFTVKIYTGYANTLNASDLVQTITMSIPASGNLPMPTANPVASYTSSTNQTTLDSGNEYTDYNIRLQTAGVGQAYQHNPHPYIVTGDITRSVQARAGGPALGDLRVIAGLADVPDDVFEGHGLKDTPSTDGQVYTDATKFMHSLRVYVSEGNEQTGKSNGFYASNNNNTGMTYLSTSGLNIRGHGKLIKGSNVLDPIASGGARPSRAPVAVQGMNGAFMDGPSATGSIPGDWDTGPGTQIDGPFINKPDEGNANIKYYNTGGNTTAGTIVETGASFSPNRQISSAVAFGSLPTGIDPSSIANTKPWRTLLFCKNPAAGSLHPGFGIPLSGTAPPYSKPPDHAFLDLFTMPIVEPYAISEPFSTAGKVNMNYQIMPFSYLTRDTGVRAVLKSTNIMAIPTADGKNYKSGTSVDFALTMPPDYRYSLDLDEQSGTLAGFQQRFSSGDIFRSASEICDIFLVPKYRVNTTTPAPGSPSYSTMGTWWNDYQLTGDNVREGPYGHIYPRLTTKSNTFTVHVQAQSIAKSRNTPADEFIEGKDQITGEFRGSFLIERYLDPNADSLVKADGKTAAGELDDDAMVGPYKFRVVSTKKFAP